MQCLRCTISFGEEIASIVTRPVTDHDSKLRQQTVCVTIRAGLVELLGADARLGLQLGPAIDVELPEEVREAVTGRLGDDTYGVLLVVYDAFSDSIFFTLDFALYRLDRENRVSRVAGHRTEHAPTDGPADVARFSTPRALCSTNDGVLYLADVHNIRLVQLPASWRAGWVGDPASAEAEPVTVTTLALNHPPVASSLEGLAYHHISSSLLFCTKHAIYRLPLSATSPGAPAPAAILLAGSEGAQSSAESVDGVGSAASFQCADSLTVDAHGSVYVVDLVDLGSDKRVALIRKLTLDGTVTTLYKEDAFATMPFILPNGYLALSGYDALHLVDLGLQAHRCGLPPPHPDQQPPRSLAGDLGSLLARQPDDSADVTVVVGDRSFPAHRILLAARCDYFRQRLQGGFEDGRAAQLALPDADPNAFALLLSFMYTGAAEGGIPPDLAAPVAELADRLLLPELRREAEEVVVAGLSPDTVVGRILWAAGLGDGFAGLLGRLKAWHVAHWEEVLAQSPGSVKVLMREGPDLMIDLVREGCARTNKKMRTA